MIGQIDWDMKVVTPLQVTLPRSGIRFAESAHAPGFAMTARADPFHKVLLVVAGEVEFHQGDQGARRVPPGGVLVVPARQRHYLSDVEPAVVMLMCFTGKWVGNQQDLGALWSSLRRRTPARVTGLERQRLEALWRRGLLEQATRQPGMEALVNAAGIEVLAILARTPTRAKDETPAARIDALAREMEAAFYEPWTLDRAARRVGMSRRSFSTHFRQRLGVTFWERLNEARLAHAANLLLAGEHSVLGVMFSCGFNDTSNFYRLFRARYGAAPLAWAEKVRHG